MNNNWFQELFINEAKTALNKDDDLYTSGQVGRIESKTQTLKVVGSDVEVIDKGEYAFLKLSDDPVDVSNVISVQSLFTFEGMEIRGERTNIGTVTVGAMTVVFDIDTNAFVLVSSLGPESDDVVPRGLWFVFAGSSGGKINFDEGFVTITTETIHPIDPKFLPPSRYLLNLSSVTIQQGESVIHPNIYDFVGLAAQNGGSFNTTIPAENCKELVAKATEWAKLSRDEDWNWLTSAPQLVVCDNIGILLMPTAIEHQHSTDPGLLQLFVGGTLRVKNGTTWITTNANCTIFFNEDGSVEFFVTAAVV